jgi:hypothetical protein
MFNKHPICIILISAVGLSLFLSIAIVGPAQAAMPDKPQDRIGNQPNGENPTETDPTGEDNVLCVTDFGDLPRYGTPAYGSSYQQASHIPQGLTLGSSVDLEDAPWSSVGATGDDLHSSPDDEEGVVRDMTDIWTPGAIVDLFVTVNGCSGTCYLNAWVDWSMDGDFSDLGEWIFNDNPITNGADQTRSLTVPGQDYPTGRNVYARFRLCRTAGTCNSPTLAYVTSGEIEDYYWAFKPTAVSLNSLRAASAARPAGGMAAAGLLGILLATWFSWRRRGSD